MIDYRALMMRKVPEVSAMGQSAGKNTRQLDDLTLKPEGVP